MNDYDCRKIIRLLNAEPPETQAAIRIVEMELELNSVKRATQASMLQPEEPAALPLFQEMEV